MDGRPWFDDPSEWRRWKRWDERHDDLVRELDELRASGEVGPEDLPAHWSKQARRLHELGATEYMYEVNKRTNDAARERIRQLEVGRRLDELSRSDPARFEEIRATYPDDVEDRLRLFRRNRIPY